MSRDTTLLVSYDLVRTSYYCFAPPYPAEIRSATLWARTASGEWFGRKWWDKVAKWREVG